MRKRLISMLLALTLLAAVAVPCASAADFPDLEGHWSQEYVTKLNTLGYLKGYPDGTARPDNDITACEALALLARFYPASDSTAQLVHQDKGEFVASNVDPTLNWAYNEIEICLAAGILTENELKNFRLTAPIQREALAVLLVRAMQLGKEAAAADITSLTYEDSADITEKNRGFVVVLTERGIVNGNTRNQFTPKASVTRGVVAAMLVRSLDYNISAGRTLRLEGYDSLAAYGGVITSFGPESLTLRDTSGIERIFDIPADATLTLDGEATRLTESLCGKHASVRVKDKIVSSVAVENADNWVQGVVDSVNQESGGYRLYVRASGSGGAEVYHIPADLAITVDGENRDPAALRQNMFVTMIALGRDVSRLIASSGTFSISGTISSMAYGAPVVVEVSDSSASRFRFYLDLTALPAISRGGKSVGVDRLSIGDTVTIRIHNCELERIVASANETTLSGVVQSITSDMAGVTWVLQELSGDTHTLTVDPAANAYQGSKAILINTIQIGDTVVVATNGHSITEIQLKSVSANTSGKLTGTVLNVDAGEKQITLSNTSNRLVYITMTAKCTILDAASGTTTTISKLNVNDQIVAYGSYSDATKFEATSIVVEH